MEAIVVRLSPCYSEGQPSQGGPFVLPGHHIHHPSSASF